MTVLGQSILAGLATILGAGLVAFCRNLSGQALAVFLGLAAGIMGGVVVLDLLPSAWLWGGLDQSILGFAAGVILVGFLERLINRLSGARENRGGLRQMGYLIAVGIALHDLPEGMAIAVGHAASAELGTLVVLAISLHNIPEGMAIAAPLFMSGVKRARVLLITLLISFFTPAGTILGLTLVAVSRQLIALLLAAAGGAMSYIVLKELIPEARNQGPVLALLGALAGVLVVMLLTFGLES